MGTHVGFEGYAISVDFKMFHISAAFSNKGMG